MYTLLSSGLKSSSFMLVEFLAIVFAGRWQEKEEKKTKSEAV